MRLEDARFAAVDLETTGLDVRRDHIVAVAAVPMEGTRIRVGDAFYTTVRPEKYRLDGMKYHGIAANDLETAPTFEEIADRLWKLCDGILVGHCVHIDSQFLSRFFGKMGRSFQRPLVDIAELEKWIGRREGRARSAEELSLDALMIRYGLKEHFRHNALADAFFAAQIFQIQVIRNGIQTVEQLLGILKDQRVCNAHFLL
ncbi:DNA polymerase-3 subunit epsilon [Desulfacinum infernum DSM 9756]|jgi:DNA polymerase-3 subunit epsilon|uniref:DNA polymerase-3 subunit epsilon n=1 Tax=Desulfacinum infernum DSM 9756 TaxID=1121391 RepID=A0A1M5F0T4_9BACT|nr:3'-5' exonuclease [Desulfacinum infernum]SHF85143.1 DNA polymerase-3 subunit epsilon [Desulfacinum infernum DSM 9756]